MLALSIAEGVRAGSFLCLPCASPTPQASFLLSLFFPLHTCSSPATPLFPLLTQKQGSVPPLKNVGAPTFSLFSPNPHSRLSFVSMACALFHFPYHTYPLHLQEYAHSSPKTGGTPPLVQPIKPVAPHQPASRRFFRYPIYFLYLLYLPFHAYQLRPAPHQLQPAPCPTLQPR
jgi:hypothetical protein